MEEEIVVLIQKGNRHFFEISIVNQQEIVDLREFANRHFTWKMDFFWYVYCLLMIVSFDTIKCGKQIYFFNKRLLL